MYGMKFPLRMQVVIRLIHSCRSSEGSLTRVERLLVQIIMCLKRASSDTDEKRFHASNIGVGLGNKATFGLSRNIRRYRAPHRTRWLPIML